MSRGLTQQQLADSVGKTKQQISDWERMRFVMEVPTAKVIALTLGCEIDDLYEWIFEAPDSKPKLPGK